MSVGDRMKKRRKELNISAEEVAKKIGVSRSNVYRYEKGEIEKMPTEILIPLSEILKTTPAYLMGWNDHQDISVIYNDLDAFRKKKVYSFAEYQLVEQKRIEKSNDENEEPESITKNKYVKDKNIKRIPKDANYTILIEGNEMAPDLNDGDVVFIKEGSIVEDGSIVVKAVAEGNKLKLLFGKIKYDYNNQKVIFTPLNKNYDSKIYGTSKIGVFGKVIK